VIFLGKKNRPHCLFLGQRNTQRNPERCGKINTKFNSRQKTIKPESGKLFTRFSFYGFKETLSQPPKATTPLSFGLFYNPTSWFL